MSRRAAVIEEVEDDEFDDDTDLPLPRLPNTGTQGPLLQELNVPASSTPATSPRPQAHQPPRQSQGETSASGENITVDPVTGKKTIWIQDASAYKMWTSIYPIYMDAKRPYGGSDRRIARDKSVWWPVSTDIVDACGQLSLRTLHEPNKRHPHDWENPGRVKVCFKQDGQLQNPRVKTKKQLLEAIARHIQQAHPDLVPHPESATSQAEVASPANASQVTDAETIPSPTKKEKAKTDNHIRTAPAPKRRMKSRMPQPPPGPPRLSQFSPAQEANILIETVKAGMNVPAPGEAASNPAAAAGKGKRKVVRIRG